MSNGVFNFNFLALVFSETLGVPNLHQVALRPLDAPQRRNFFTQSEYFTIPNCVFNFSFLSLVLYEIFGWSQIYIRGHCAPLGASQRKNFYTQDEYFGISLAFFISTFQLQQFLRYQGGPKFTLGPMPPSGEIFVPNASTSQYLIVLLISTIQLQYFSRYQRVPNLHQGALRPPPPGGPLAEKF